VISVSFFKQLTFRSHFTFKLRNYDPETKQMRKRDAQDGGEDTVEKAVEGLAESILREDAEKRKEELVSFGLSIRRRD
jgi:coiled-coil domain-containing protein 12